MKVKCLEIRDRATFIPVICIDMNPDNEEQRYLLRRCGHACDCFSNILVTRISADGTPAWNDPYGWKDARTMPVSHDWIINNWSDINDGDVIDVEFILGEKLTKKVSERFGG